MSHEVDGRGASDEREDREQHGGFHGCAAWTLRIAAGENLVRLHLRAEQAAVDFAAAYDGQEHLDGRVSGAGDFQGVLAADLEPAVVGHPDAGGGEVFDHDAEGSSGLVVVLPLGDLGGDALLDAVGASPVRGNVRFLERDGELGQLIVGEAHFSDGPSTGRPEESSVIWG